jgi:hypothetical protein
MNDKVILTIIIARRTRSRSASAKSLEPISGAMVNRVQSKRCSSQQEGCKEVVEEVHSEKL